MWYAKCYQGNEIKEDEIDAGYTSSTHEGDEKFVQNFSLKT